MHDAESHEKLATPKCSVLNGDMCDKVMAAHDSIVRATGLSDYGLTSADSPGHNSATAAVPQATKTTFPHNLGTLDTSVT